MTNNNGYGYAYEEPKTPTSTTDIHPSNQSVEKRSDKTIYYYVDDDLTAAEKIGVDTDKSQIIILRYFRVLPEEQKGSYK